MDSLGAILLALSAFLHFSDSAKILGVFPFPAKSHMNVNEAVMLELARRGHDLTVITAFPLKNPPPKYKEIVVPNILEAMKDTASYNVYDLYELSVPFMIYFMFSTGNHITDGVLGNPGIQKLIHSKEKFDLVIAEVFYMDGVFGFAHKFDAPLVLISPNVAMNWVGDFVGNPHPYAYVPDLFTSYTDKMNLFERVKNTYSGFVSILGRQLLGVPTQNALLKKHFNYTDNFPTIQELESRVAVILANSHFSINRPRPYLPNVIEVGGLHIKEPKALPKDLKAFLDSAKDGVIYFSMGSHIRSADLPVKKRDAILKALSKLKQKVLWKWEDDNLPGKPDNVKVEKWFPQSDILAHPNIKLFISHGGLLGAQESLYHGVPILGIPIMGDQQSNMNKAEMIGYGLTVRLTDLTEELFLNGIREMLNNPKYRDNAQRISRAFRDTPMKPLDTAVYWTEYVIRHQGAPHLKSAAIDLSWYQYFLLDVILIFLVSLIVASYVFFYVIIKIMILIFGKQNSSKSNKKLN